MTHTHWDNPLTKWSGNMRWWATNEEWNSFVCAAEEISKRLMKKDMNGESQFHKMKKRKEKRKEKKRKEKKR